MSGSTIQSYSFFDRGVSGAVHRRCFPVSYSGAKKGNTTFDLSDSPMEFNLLVALRSVMD
jgi:hypothetical protein